MPNWCSNHIVIEGPTNEVEAIWSKANDNSEDGLLGALHPIGEWDYHTALEEWGTKWDVNMTDANLELEKINGPIGIKLGGKSPSEIALSIISQLVSEKYKNKI